MGKINSLGLKSFWPIFSGHQSDSASWTWKKKDSKFWKKKAGRPKDFSGFSFLERKLSQQDRKWEPQAAKT